MWCCLLGIVTNDNIVTRYQGHRARCQPIRGLSRLPLTNQSDHTSPTSDVSSRSWHWAMGTKTKTDGLTGKTQSSAICMMRPINLCLDGSINIKHTLKLFCSDMSPRRDNVRTVCVCPELYSFLSSTSLKEKEWETMPYRRVSLRPFSLYFSCCKLKLTKVLVKSED